MQKCEEYLLQKFPVSQSSLLDQVPHSPSLLTGHHHTCLPKCDSNLHPDSVLFIQDSGPLDVGYDSWIKESKTTPGLVMRVKGDGHSRVNFSTGHTVCWSGPESDINCKTCSLTVHAITTSFHSLK